MSDVAGNGPSRSWRKLGESISISSPPQKTRKGLLARQSRDSGLGNLGRLGNFFCCDTEEARQLLRSPPSSSPRELLDVKLHHK